MKKVGVFLLIFVLALSFVIAQGNESADDRDTESGSSQNSIDKAYQCLSDLIDDKEESELSLQEAIFSTLALGSDAKLNSIIEDEEGNDCWPEVSCTIKETAQVLLAKDRINQNTADIESWLLSKNGTATELTWFLQVDISNHVSATCHLTYRDTERTINIGEDMKISGNPGDCFSISSSNFWLRVNNNCMEEEFRISCDEDFVTSLIYQRTGGQTIFVTPNAHSASGLGTTTEKINSLCLKTGNSCDYEGTLWSALSLGQTGNEVSSFLPYLLALSEENRKFFPSAFLYEITQGNDQFSEIVEAQIQGKYWQAPATQYNRFYDTSLAMLALQGTSSQELTAAQEYFTGIQTPEGCWNNNNIRDTAFTLYSGFPRDVRTGGGGSGGSATQSCVQATGNECVSPPACAQAGGTALDFDCDLGICCSVSLTPPSCAEQLGIVCTSSQQCSGTTTSSSDGSCCLGSCQEIVQVTECESSGGICESSCIDGETQTSDSCNNPGLVCCIQSTSGSDEGSSVWVWVIIFLILIILAVLAIIYRKKLQLAWFRFRNKEKGGNTKDNRKFPERPPAARPTGPPPGARFGGPPMRKPTAPARPLRRAPVKSPGSKEDKELEETLKKLKEMSK